MNTLRRDKDFRLRSVPIPLLVFAGAWLLLAAYWQWLAQANGIFGEMWDTLPAFQQLHTLSAIDIFRELMRKYALVHIIALPKLFFWVDFAEFGASGRFTRACSFLVSLACAGCLWRIALRDFSRSIVVTVLALLLFFNPLQTYVINWESLLQYYLSVFFALLAYRLRWQKKQQLWLPCLFLLLSAWSCGSSIAAIAGFTGLLFLQWRDGVVISTAQKIAYTCFFVLMVWMLKPDAGGGVLLDNPQPFFWNAPNLLLQYLVFPFSAWGDCRWLGVLMLMAVLHSVWRCWMHKGQLSDHIFILFFLIACTIALGRYKWMGLDSDVSRYYVYIAPLWYFFLLKLMPISTTKKNVWMVNAAVFAVTAGILCASATSAVVLGNYANKMDMARIVALNGNTKHLASLRLDALQGLPANIENSREYLRQNHLDIYYQTKTVLKFVDTTCSAQLAQQSLTTKGRFVDYVLQESESNPFRIKNIYLTDERGAVQYYGVAYAAATHVTGWNIALRDVRFADWPLLLPVSRLPITQRRLYVHLPKATRFEDGQWWGENDQGSICHLVVSR